MSLTKLQDKQFLSLPQQSHSTDSYQPLFPQNSQAQANQEGAQAQQQLQRENSHPNQIQRPSAYGSNVQFTQPMRRQFENTLPASTYNQQPQQMWSYQDQQSEVSQKESLNYLQCLFKDRFSVDQLKTVLHECAYDSNKAYKLLTDVEFKKHQKEQESKLLVNQVKQSAEEFKNTVTGQNRPISSKRKRGQLAQIQRDQQDTRISSQESQGSSNRQKESQTNSGLKEEPQPAQVLNSEQKTLVQEVSKVLIQELAQAGMTSDKAQDLLKQGFEHYESKQQRAEQSVIPDLPGFKTAETSDLFQASKPDLVKLVQYLTFKNDSLSKGINVMNKKLTKTQEKKTVLKRENHNFRQLQPDYLRLKGIESACLKMQNQPAHHNLQNFNNDRFSGGNGGGPIF